VATGPYVTGLIGDRAGLTAGLSWGLVPGAAGLALVGVLGLAQLRQPVHREPKTPRFET
jgi:hypothetical protein